jgi:hypothetical protein
MSLPDAGKQGGPKAPFSQESSGPKLTRQVTSTARAFTAVPMLANE